MVDLHILLWITIHKLIMPECINCGAYTKFENGLCLNCYKKEHSKKPEEEKPLKNNSNNNPWTSGVIKGRIAETIVEELFKSLGFQVFKYGMENSIPGIMELLTGVRGDVAKNIRQMPDLVVFKNNQAHFIEVKFRASGELKLSDIEKYGDYPFENALFVLVTKKHIKCISYEELKAGGVISSDGRNHLLGNRKEFETDRDMIIEYTKYAVKFFEFV